MLPSVQTSMVRNNCHDVTTTHESHNTMENTNEFLAPKMQMYRTSTDGVSRTGRQPKNTEASSPKTVQADKVFGKKMIYFFLYATTNSFNFLILLPNLAHILSNALAEFTHI